MTDNALISSFIPPPSSLVVPLPEPKAAIAIRRARREDIPFIDALQKLHRRAVGFMPAKWLEEKIENSSREGATTHVLIAESLGAAVGYAMGNDRYCRRDELGIVHQMNVVPGVQRGYIGAALLRALFDASAYGTKLFCCWCAQDLPANRFWESMGFVPIAYRAGGRRSTVNGTKANLHRRPSTVDRRPASTSSGRNASARTTRARRTGSRRRPRAARSGRTGSSCRFRRPCVGTTSCRC